MISDIRLSLVSQILDAILTFAHKVVHHSIRIIERKICTARSKADHRVVSLEISGEKFTEIYCKPNLSKNF